MRLIHYIAQQKKTHRVVPVFTHFRKTTRKKTAPAPHTRCVPAFVHLPPQKKKNNIDTLTLIHRSWSYFAKWPIIPWIPQFPKLFPFLTFRNTPASFWNASELIYLQADNKQETLIRKIEWVSLGRVSQWDLRKKWTIYIKLKKNTRKTTQNRYQSVVYKKIDPAPLMVKSSTGASSQSDIQTAQGATGTPGTGQR